MKVRYRCFNNINLESLNYTYSYGLVWFSERANSQRWIRFFRMDVFGSETDVRFYIRCNISTFSVSVKSIDVVCIQYKILCQKFFSMKIIFSIFGERLFTFISERGIPFLSKTFHLRQSIPPKDVLDLSLSHQRARVTN